MKPSQRHAFLFVCDKNGALSMTGSLAPWTETAYMSDILHWIKKTMDTLQEKDLEPNEFHRIVIDMPIWVACADTEVGSFLLSPPDHIGVGVVVDTALRKEPVYQVYERLMSNANINVYSSYSPQSTSEYRLKKKVPANTFYIGTSGAFMEFISKSPIGKITGIQLNVAWDGNPVNTLVEVGVGRPTLTIEETPVKLPDHDGVSRTIQEGTLVHYRREWAVGTTRDESNRPRNSSSPRIKTRSMSNRAVTLDDIVHATGNGNGSPHTKPVKPAKISKMHPYKVYDGVVGALVRAMDNEDDPKNAAVSARIEYDFRNSIPMFPQSYTSWRTIVSQFLKINARSYGTHPTLLDALADHFAPGSVSQPHAFSMAFDWSSQPVDFGNQHAKLDLYIHKRRNKLCFNAIAANCTPFGDLPFQIALVALIANVSSEWLSIPMENIIYNCVTVHELPENIDSFKETAKKSIRAKPMKTLQFREIRDDAGTLISPSNLRLYNFVIN